MELRRKVFSYYFTEIPRTKAPKIPSLAVMSLLLVKALMSHIMPSQISAAQPDFAEVLARFLDN